MSAVLSAYVSARGCQRCGSGALGRAGHALGEGKTDMTGMDRKAGTALRAHTRYRYSAIRHRQPFRWPNGARVALYFALGVEEYSFGEGLTENLVSAGSHPDVLNSSWRDYGNRVGAWRLLEAFREYRLPLSILLNSAVCESAPDLVKAAQDQG